MLSGVVKKEGRNEKQIEGGTTGTRGGEWVPLAKGRMERGEEGQSDSLNQPQISEGSGKKAGSASVLWKAYLKENCFLKN